MGGQLKIKVVKARHLKNKHNPIGGKCNPYVIVELEESNLLKFDKDHGTQRTSTLMDTTDPDWNEEFTFNIPSLKNMVVALIVKDENTFRDKKEGKCKIHLDKEGITASPKRIVEVIDKNLFSNDGKIEVEISYHE